MRKWTVDGSAAKKTYQMFSLERKARLFFHLETFCLTTADLQPKIPWKGERARPRSVPRTGLYMDIF